MMAQVAGVLTHGSVNCTECGGGVRAVSDLFIEVIDEDHLHFLCGSCLKNTDQTVCDKCITPPKE